MPGVETVFIGIDEQAELAAPSPWADDRPVVVYGTSITQGGCATRPGMAYTNIVSRELNRPVINLGFSGNGKGEAEVAAELAHRLRGKHKPIYTPHVDAGDYLVVINAEKIVVTGKKLTDK